MVNKVGTFLLMIFILNLGYAQESDLATEAELQPWIDAEKESVRAKTGDVISVDLLSVSDDHKQEFETWVADVLYDALYKSDNPMKKAQLNAVRWFEPMSQNEDGSWSYCWIMDPIIPKTVYDIELFLKQELGADEAKMQWEKYLSMVTQQQVLLRQTDK